nr:hypothetical protein [Vallicoccus soli]
MSASATSCRGRRRADELTDDELRAGPARVEALARRWAPAAVAVLGISAYRTGWGRRDARVGPQGATVAGRPLWVLPNPSGLNASYQQPALTAAFAELAASLPPAAPHEGHPQAPAPDEGAPQQTRLC